MVPESPGKAEAGHGGAEEGRGNGKSNVAEEFFRKR